MKITEHVIIFFLFFLGTAFFYLSVRTEIPLQLLAPEGHPDADKIRTLLTPFKLRALFTLFGLLFMVASFLVLFFGKRIAFFLKSAFLKTVSLIGKTYSSLTSKQKLAVLTLILLHTVLSLYRATEVPVTNDEAFTFLNYIDRGFAAAFAFYNEPNNHVLYSLMANVTDMIPFVDAGLKMRIPSLLIGAATCIAFYVLALRTCKKHVAEIALGLFIVLYLTVKYHFLARGYGLMMLCYIVNLHAVLRLTDHKKDTSAQLIFILSAVAGMYAHPTYVIPLVSFFVIPFIAKERSHFKRLIMPVVTAGLLTAVLYAPPLILNGVEAFTSNSGLDRPGFTGLIMHSGRNIIGVFTQNAYGSIVGLVLTVILLTAGTIFSRNKQTVKYLIFAVLTCFVFFLAVGSAMFVRNLLWLIVPATLIMSNAFSHATLKSLMRQYATLLFIVFIFLIAAVRIYVFPDYFDRHYHRLYQAYDFVEALPDNYETLYSEHKADYYTILRFHGHIKNGKSGTLYRRDFDASMPYEFILNVKKEGDRHHVNSRHVYERFYEDDYVQVLRIVSD